MLVFQVTFRPWAKFYTWHNYCNIIVTVKIGGKGGKKKVPYLISNLLGGERLNENI